MPKRTQVDGREEAAGMGDRSEVDDSSPGCLGCSLVTDSPVSLRNGTVVCSDCPEYHRERLT
jgi:hypothetical protein